MPVHTHPPHRVWNNAHWKEATSSRMPLHLAWAGHCLLVNFFWEEDGHVSLFLFPVLSSRGKIHRHMDTLCVKLPTPLALLA